MLALSAFWTCGIAKHVLQFIDELLYLVPNEDVAAVTARHHVLVFCAAERDAFHGLRVAVAWTNAHQVMARGFGKTARGLEDGEKAVLSSV